MGTNTNSGGRDMTRHMDYALAGVLMDEEQDSAAAIRDEIQRIKAIRTGRPGDILLDIGHFTGLVRLDEKTGLALCTDGVGTKAIVAELAQVYDTIGIDCVAMNVNDLICIGAEPISFVDYLAMTETDPKIAREIGKGLVEGARQADITISGGEIASLKDVIKVHGKGPAFDLAGMAAGLIDLDRLIDGSDLGSSEEIVALKSTGLHSNGYSLARLALFETHDYKPSDYIDELGCTLGEELLKPTGIYVREVLEMLRENEVHALSHITSWGLLNLQRIGRHHGIGFVIDKLISPQPIFDLIQRLGGITDFEMYRTFNMGIGFCVITPSSEVDDVIDIAEKHGSEACVIGHTVKHPQGKVALTEKGIEMKGKKISA